MDLEIKNNIKQFKFIVEFVKYLYNIYIFFFKIWVNFFLPLLIMDIDQFYSNIMIVKMNKKNVINKCKCITISTYFEN